MSQLPRIPGYKIIRKLGHGGMADVFLGVQENLDREVAIKLLIPSLFRDDQFAVRFVKEARTAAQLAHPNIITIHDIGKVEASYFIVMEYLEESLCDRMKKEKKLSPDDAIHIVKKIALALDYAHKKGFIHRDIKPDNIMFRSDGAPVLVDFGIARAMDATTQLTRTGMSIGTPHYMSPEQCRGEKIDGRSDIYSLGVQFFELITGNVPYKAENTAGIILKHIQSPVPRLPESLVRFQPLIDRMMAKDKEMRIAGGGELINFVDGLVTAQQSFPTLASLRQEMSPMQEMVPTQEQPTMLTPEPMPAAPSAPAGTGFRKERKKWPYVAAAFAVLVVAASVAAYLAKGKPVNDTDPTAAVTEPIEGETPSDLNPPETASPPAADKAAEKEKITDEIQPTDTQPKDTQPADVKQKGAAPSKSVVNIPVKDKPAKVRTPDPGQTNIKKKGTVSPAAPPLRERQYRDYFQKAQTAYNAGDYERARDNLEKAAARKKTPELRDLADKIRQAHQQAAREQVKPKTQPKPTPPRVKSGTLIDLSTELRMAYNKRLQRLGFQLPRRARIRPSGQIIVTLSIDENGSVTATGIDDRLTAPQKRARRVLLELFKRKFAGIKLAPPKNKTGEPIRVHNWRVTYKVGVFMGKLILTKQ